MNKQSNQAEKELSTESQIDLRVEELEAVIAPKLAANHNETLITEEIGLVVEELEAVIAPKLSANHNEILVSDTTP
jgi:hypothetical protein